MATVVAARSLSEFEHRRQLRRRARRESPAPAEKSGAAHQNFVERERLDDTVYPNGISASLPRPVQEALLRTSWASNTR